MVAQSETVQLARALALLDDLRHFLAAGNMPMAESVLARTEIILERLAKQVGHGFHANPPLHVHRTGARNYSARVVGAISKEAHAVLYRHAEDGRQYRHDFVNATSVLALVRGDQHDVLITSPDGWPIWQDF